MPQLPELSDKASGHVNVTSPEAQAITRTLSVYIACLSDKRELEVVTDATACHLIQQVLIWLVLILGIPHGFVWYQYCNEENVHSHQYLDDRGCTSQGDPKTSLRQYKSDAQGGLPVTKGLCFSDWKHHVRLHIKVRAVALKCQWPEGKQKRGADGCTRSPGHLRKCARAPRPPTWHMLNDQDVKFL